MSSPASETLEAYGIITSQRAFHTYVVCSATGDKWDCHGTPYTPVHPPLCSGNGSVLLARCIYGNDETGLGPYYGKAGVCHQMANRLLAVAGVELPLSSHYQVRATRLSFRRFGHNFPWMPTANHWPDRLLGCQSGGTIASSQGSTTGQIDHAGVLSSMTEPVFAISNPDPISEMASLIEAAGLDHPIDQKQLYALAAMQERLQSRIATLAEMHTKHQISSKKYVQELDFALREASMAGEKIIGLDDFHQVFGELKAEQLIDTDAFFRNNEG